MDQFEHLRSLLDPFSKADIGFYPTPLHRLSNVSADQGVNVYIKREDFSGVFSERRESLGRFPKTSWSFERVMPVAIV